MDGLKIDHPLFSLIISDHYKIINILNNFEKNNEILLLQQVNQLWNFVELTHHKKEEFYLFNFVSKKERISEGGPLCTLYFDYHMAEPAPIKSAKITNQIPPIEDHQINYYKNNSPVTIPVDEHRAGKSLLNHLKQNWDNLTLEKKLSALEVYRDINLNYIAKEESCFFHLCAHLLTPNEANHILCQWQNHGESD